MARASSRVGDRRAQQLDPDSLVALPLSCFGAARRRQAAHQRRARGKLNGIEATDISDSPVPGIYQVAVGANVAYVTNDGNYIFRGDIYDAETERQRHRGDPSRARVAMLESRRPEEHDRVQPAGR